MNVLSTFNGMGCIWIALDKLGIAVEKRYSCEIDKYANIVNDANYPDTIQLGDVTKVKGSELEDVGLLVGGSPCQGFSFAGKQLNFEDPRSKLFFEFARLKEESKAKYFLLENVKMKKEYQDVISSYLGVEPIEINSSLVSAQNRKRLYWTNIPGVTQPEDKEIFLKDILEDGSSKVGAQRGRYIVDGKRADHKVPSMAGKTEQRLEIRKDNKSNCLTTVGKDNIVLTKFKVSDIQLLRLDISKAEEGGVKGCFKNPIVKTVKSECLLARDYKGIPGKQNFTMAFQNGILRKLTPIECERLQTVPSNYTNHVSNSQRYKMLGNGWTVDVIAHILKGIEPLY